MKKSNVVYKDDSKNYELPGLIISMVILIALIVFIILLLLGVFKPKQDKDSPNEPDINELNRQYDTLLKRLNSYISLTEAEPNEKANKVISFTYSNNIFHIAGSNSTRVYDYKLDFTTNNFSNMVDAYNYVIANEIATGSIPMEIDRYSLTTSEEFANKYNEGNINYGIGNIATQSRVFAVIERNDNKVYVIYGEKLDTVLNETYTPNIIEKTNDLYNIYKLIASK